MKLEAKLFESEILGGMREIKFRALKDDMSNCNFIYGTFVKSIDELSSYAYIVDIKGNSTSIILNSLGQFTGFKDKKGVEIYEGDIIGDDVSIDGKMEKSKMQVYFDGSLGQWMLDCSYSQDKSNGYALFKELEDFELEIVGNIHENT